MSKWRTAYSVEDWRFGWRLLKEYQGEKWNTSPYNLKGWWNGRHVCIMEHILVIRLNPSYILVTKAMVESSSLSPFTYFPCLTIIKLFLGASCETSSCGGLAEVVNALD